MTNEEKILELLEQQGKTLNQHSVMLERHSELLEAQGKTLEQQGKTLEQHSKLLEAQGKTLEQHSKLLEAQGKTMEQHSNMLAELYATVTKVAVTQEAVVLPRLEALAEGHANILDTLAPKNRVEALEDEMGFMKSVIKAMSQEIAELKKAQ